MGLQNGKRAPGWYNGYNIETFQDADYDTATQAEVAKKNICNSLDAFASGKRDAVTFFTKKMASQWNNPTFQGYWNVQKRRPALKITPPVAWFVSAQGEDVAVNYLNALQMVVLSGALFWALGCAAPRAGRQPYRAYVLPLVFVGGFLCHIFWEAKCQYVMPYFGVLFPLCAMGYARMARYARAALSALRGEGPSLGKRAGAFVRARVGAAVGLGVSCAIVVAIGAAGGLAAITGAASAYSEWLAGNPNCPLINKEPFIGSHDADRFM